MSGNKLSIALRVTLAICAVTLGASTCAATETQLYSFGSYSGDGAYPDAGLILDAKGNLYGTTLYGGAGNYGSVFELVPKAGGGWTERELYSFGSYSRDGIHPYASLTLDLAGHLYGTTYEGGAHKSGAVFELTQKAGGGWSETVLHSFGRGQDGALPRAGLITDAGGNLYGTTLYGGAYGLGTVFELTPKAGGKWAEEVLHSFDGKDGKYASTSLIFDHAGNLYGATESTIFELTHKAGGGWTEKALSNFGTTASLTFGAAGNLYGTTSLGGTYGQGTVFELARKAGGKWTYLALYDFTGGVDGANPYAGLILGHSGNLYGTTYQGGGRNFGTAFEIKP